MTTMVLPIVNATVMSILNATLGKQEVQESNLSLFGRRYGKVHGYVSILVCIFGVISNILNAIVLTRRQMTTPTNYILTALAVADCLQMLTYPVYAIYSFFYKQDGLDANHSQGWMNYMVVQNIFNTTCHNMAMWLTVSLAVFRYIFVCHHGIVNRLCSLQRALLTIKIIVIANAIVCIPDIFLYRVVKPTDFGLNISGFVIANSRLVVKHNFYKTFNYWFFAVIMKVVPCILLTLLSAIVILAMYQASKRRVRLLQQTRPSDHNVNRKHNRTTWMLVSVVLFSVITEMPHGILIMLSGLNKDFHIEVYSKLGDIKDLLLLLNSSLNFVLYSIMSKKFRDTFKKLFVVNFMCHKHNETGRHNVYVILTNTEVTTF